jgi:membrane-bound serine protease (ClpP class)
VLLGIVLLAFDLNYPTHGVLTIAGLVSLGFGLASLFQSSSGGPHTSIPLVVAVTLVLGGLWAFAITKALAVRRRPVAVGPQEIVGMRGVVRENGLVAVRGELWKVRAEEPLHAGEPVQVDALDGLTLRVHRIAQ